MNKNIEKTQTTTEYKNKTVKNIIYKGKNGTRITNRSIELINKRYEKEYRKKTPNTTLFIKAYNGQRWFTITHNTINNWQELEDYYDGNDNGNYTNNNFTYLEVKLRIRKLKILFINYLNDLKNY